MADNVTRGYGLLEKFLSSKRAKIADSHIPDNLRDGKILDLGCGFYPYFLSAIEFKDKFGMNSDFSNEPIAGMNLIKSEFNVGAVLPFADSFFNVVTLLAVAEHLEPKVAIVLFQEVRRVLSPDGILIITVPWGKADLFFKFLSKIKFLSSVEVNDHRQFYNRSAIRNQLLLAGFEDGKITTKKFELGLNLFVLVKK